MRRRDTIHADYEVKNEALALRKDDPEAVSPAFPPTQLGTRPKGGGVAHDSVLERSSTSSVCYYYYYIIKIMLSAYWEHVKNVS